MECSFGHRKGRKSNATATEGEECMTKFNKSSDQKIYEDILQSRTLKVHENSGTVMIIGRD
jgi:hypothetical protein